MSKIATLQNQDAETLRVNEKKWSKPLWSAGWTGIPSIIIEKQEALGLDALDVNIILHLCQYWWRKENLPHPSVGTIAKALQVQPRTVQKRIKALQTLGLMERHERRNSHGGNMTNEYSFDGLIKAARPFAEEKLKQLADAAEAKKARVARKKPKLVVDNED